MITIAPRPSVVHDLGQLSPSDAVAALDYALARFKAIGVPAPRGSRLDKARNQLIRPDDYAMHLRRSTAARRVTAEAMRVAFEFHQVARTLNPRFRPFPELLRHDLARSFNGRLDPLARDATTTAARNLQFQLWLASWFVAGGREVRYEEPDVQVDFAFKHRGVAAKRVQAPSKIIRRTRRAAEQIHAHADTGFVAIAIDNYSPAFHSRIGSRRAPTRVFRLIPELREAASWCAENAPWVVSYMAFGTLAQWRLRGATPEVGFSFIHLTILLAPTDQEKRRLRDSFEDLMLTYRRRISGP